MLILATTPTVTSGPAQRIVLEVDILGDGTLGPSKELGGNTSAVRANRDFPAQRTPFRIEFSNPATGAILAFGISAVTEVWSRI
jgi:hypothetical protein